MKKIVYLSFFTIFFMALFACDPFKDLPVTVTLTQEVVAYAKNSVVTEEQFINEVLKNPIYINFTQANLDKCSIDFPNGIDTSSVGKKRIEFTLTNKHSSFSNLYIYIYVYDGDTQFLPIESAIKLERFSFAKDVVRCNKATYTIEPLLEPANTNQVDFLFSITKGDNIAQVDSYGVVTKRQNGEVTIKVTSYYDSTITKTITIEFYDGVDIESASFNPVASPTDQTTIDLNSVLVLTPANTTDTDFIWTSSNLSVATISDGILKRISYGSTTINISNVNNPDVKASITIDFTRAPQEYTLTDIPSAALNRSYQRIFALDFDSETLPTGVTKENGLISSGCWIRNNSTNTHLFIPKSLIKDFTYMVMVVKDHETPNTWCRGQNDESNCGEPLEILRWSNWGIGWSGANGGPSTGFSSGNTFYELGYLIDNDTIYQTCNSVYNSRISGCSAWTNGISSYDYFTIRLQSGTTTLDYLAFYK